MKRILSVAVFSILILGCTGAPKKAILSNERIMVYGDFVSKTYQQKGETILYPDLINALEVMEETKVSARKSKRWSYFTLPSAVAGGAVAISSLVDNNQSTGGRDGRLIAGLGLVGISLMTAFFAQENLDQSVDEFNQKFPSLPQPDPTAEPENNRNGFFHFNLIPEKDDLALKLTGGWNF